MKRFISMIIVLSLMVPLSGCFTSDEVANELIAYHNSDWVTFKKMNDEMLGPFEAPFTITAMGKDVEGIKILIEEEILPVQSVLVDYLEGVNLEHKEVQELNQLMIEIEKKTYKGFEKIATMIEEMDRQELEESFDILMEHEHELHEMLDDFHNEREELMEKYDVQWIEENEEYGERINKMEKKEDD